MSATFLDIDSIFATLTRSAQSEDKDELKKKYSNAWVDQDGVEVIWSPSEDISDASNPALQGGPSSPPPSPPFSPDSTSSFVSCPDREDVDAGDDISEDAEDKDKDDPISAKRNSSTEDAASDEAEELTGARRDLKRLNKLCKSLEQALQTTRDDLEQNKSASNREIGEVKEKNRSLEAALATMNRQHAQCIQPGEYYKTVQKLKVEEYEEREIELQKQVDARDERIKALENERKSMKVDYEDRIKGMRNSFAASKVEMQGILNDLDLRIQTLLGQLADKDESIQQLGNLDEANKAEIRSRESEMEELRKTHFSQQEQREHRIRFLVEQTDSLTRNLSFQRNVVRSLEDDLQQRDGQIKEQHAKLEVVNITLVEARLNGDSLSQVLSRERQSFNRKNDLSRKRISSLEIRLKESVAAEAFRKEQLLKTDSKLTQSQNTVEMRNQEIEKLKARLVDLKQTLNEERHEWQRREKDWKQQEEEWKRREEEWRRQEKERAENAQKEEAKRRRMEEELQKEHRWKDAEQRELDRCRCRDQKWKDGAWTPKKALDRFQELSLDFLARKFSPEMPLTRLSVPWPVLSAPDSLPPVDTIEWEDVEKFFSSSRAFLKPETHGALLAQTQQMFHPDRWRSRRVLDSVIDLTVRGQLERAGNIVAQAVTGVRSQSKS